MPLRRVKAPGVRARTTQETPRFRDENGHVSENGSQPLCVLVVDDEQNIADVISMALRYEGFEVETAGNGTEALAAVDSYRPHLMVLDIMLPDMEGFEVAKRLGGERAELPI